MFIMNRTLTIAADRPGEALPDGAPLPGETLPYGRLRNRPRKGRGALSNRAGRFERLASERIDDGWGEPLPPRTPEPDPLDDGIDPFGDSGNGDAALPPLRTTVTTDTSRTVIARNTSPDIGFDRSINLYRGCEHGCVYCFARPSHAFLGLSAGLDFETKLFAKPDAAALLRRELAKPGYVPRTIAMGTNTDPYQPVEREMKITRQILEVLAEHRHPVSIVTKSALVMRDIDILAPMAEQGLASVALSVTTCDAALARAMEPRASSPAKRLDAIRQLARAGIPTGVMVAPVIPGLTDHELEAILIRAHDAGAERAGYILLRLPRELRGLFDEWLDVHAPDRKQRILNRIREMRGGDLYQSEFGTRMRGTGAASELLQTRFHLACRRLGFTIDGRTSHRRTLDTGRFTVPATPPRAAAAAGQLALFG
jgi:DNA repair photolyase